MKSMPSKYRKKLKAFKEWYSKEVVTKKIIQRMHMKPKKEIVKCLTASRKLNDKTGRKKKCCNNQDTTRRSSEA